MQTIKTYSKRAPFYNALIRTYRSVWFKLVLEMLFSALIIL
jgi:hypothetical protein